MKMREVEREEGVRARETERTKRGGGQKWKGKNEKIVIICQLVQKKP